MSLGDRLIRLHEGLRLRPYVCTAGKLSIGYGRNLQDCGSSRDEAELLFANDMARVDRELRAALPWVLGLDAERYAVLQDMAYNLGVPKLLTFTRTLGSVERGG